MSKNDLPGEALQYGLSSLADRFAQTVTATSPNPAVNWLARQLWLGLEEGHTALSHDFVCTGIVLAGFELKPTLDSIFHHHAIQHEAHLLDERPIVFGYGHWYLQRYARLEQRISSALRALNQEQICPPHVSIAAASARLNTLQARALKLATERRLLVLTGGPGTGKTFTLAAIVTALRDALTDSQNDFKVVACAPTGKAAVRLAQQGIYFDQVATIQRLLSQPRTTEGFIDAGLVVVDEASMIDTTLADELLSAIGPLTRIIFAGDRNQLSAVRAGAVFSQLGALSEARVELTESVRFAGQSVVGQLAQAILGGDLLGAPLSDQARCLLTEVKWVTPQPLHANNRLQQAWCDALMSGYSPLLELIAQPTFSDSAALEVLAQLNKFRALTSTHDGPVGTKSSHDILTRWFASRLRVLREQFAQPQLGRVVIVVRNDELTGLRNGDVGVILNSEQGVRAVFEGSDSSIPRWIKLSLLPAHEDGLVLTVHKSQGSEYDSVLFALPEFGSPQSRLEVVYTAVTRAKADIQLLGTPEQLCAAVAKRSERFSGLDARLNN